MPYHSANHIYLDPKELAPRYALAYSTFVRHLKVVVQRENYPKGAFWVTKQIDPQKREHLRVRIHSVIGVAFLDGYFDARQKDVA